MQTHDQSIVSQLKKQQLCFFDKKPNCIFEVSDRVSEKLPSLLDISPFKDPFSLKMTI